MPKLRDEPAVLATQDQAAQEREQKAQLVLNEGEQWDLSCMSTAKALLAAVNQAVLRATHVDAKGKQEILLSEAAIIRLSNAAGRAQEMGQHALEDVRQLQRAKEK